MDIKKIIPLFIIIIILLYSQIIKCQNYKKNIFNSSKYLKAAITLGDYLLEVKDNDTKSWSTVWNPKATDAISSFYAMCALYRLTKISNENKFKEAAEKSIQWWIENMFLDEEEKCSKWNWFIDNKVQEIKGWENGEWEKCSGGFVAQYYKEKDGNRAVRVGTINTRDGATLGIEILKNLPEQESNIELLKNWFTTDLANKSPKSGKTGYRGYMTVQSMVDTNKNGYIEISPQYSLWGGRYQSSLVNAQMILDLKELGLIKLIKERAEWLVNVMKNKITGNFFETFDVDNGLPSVGYKSNFTFANGQVVEGLFAAYEVCKEKKYLFSALEALDWLIKTQAYIDNKIVFFTEDKVYRTFTAVPALCKAYSLTGKKEYLIYALATGDWIISQMKLPFDGFEDKNAWTVAEGLEALVSICEMNLR